MKNLIFSLVMSGSMLLVANNSTAQTGSELTWQKSSPSVWQGKKDNVVYMYQLDGNGKLAWSTDNDTWVVVPDNMWVDYYDNWYRIEKSDLMYSSDHKNWVVVPGKYWRGTDGYWYSFDDNWVLWVGGNGEEPPVSLTGTSNPYGGSDPNQHGSNSNGDQGGYQNNTGTQQNGGSNSSGGYNRQYNSNGNQNTNTGGGTINPK